MRSNLTGIEKPWKVAAALGELPETVIWNKWGYNADVDSAAPETIWTEGGRVSLLSSAQQMNIASTSTADDGDPAGTGANTLRIWGVDGSFNEITEDVTLDGTTNVLTTQSFRGINRMSITSAGTGMQNAGTITAKDATSATTQAAIPATEGSTQHAFFFTAAGKAALADWLWINVNKITGASPVVTINAYVTSLVSDAEYNVFSTTIDTNVENTIELNPAEAFVVGEKSVLEFVATTDSNDTIVNCRFSLVQSPT